MQTRAIQLFGLFPKLVKTNAFAPQKAALLNGLALALTCGIGAASSSPAQAASFNGFGCSDNPSCQTYYEFFNADASAGIGPSSDTWSLPATRSSSPVLSPNHSVSALYNDSVFDGAGSPIINYSGGSSATLSTILKLGQLRALATATADASITVDRNYSTISTYLRAGAATETYLGWGDTITATSNTYAAGELVPFEAQLSFDRILKATGKYGGNSQAFASANLTLSRLFAVDIFDSNFYPSNVTTAKTIVYLPIGEPTSIEGRLGVFASAEAYAYNPDQLIDRDVSSVDASHTANYFLTPLLSDVSYTSASGQTYFYSGNATPVPTPALLPGLIGLGLGLWRKRKAEAES